jgi:hypothetical protein
MRYLESYSSIGRLGKVYGVIGVIAFILDHPAEVEAYLKDQERLADEIQARYPMSQDMIDRLRRAMGDVPIETL